METLDNPARQIRPLDLKPSHFCHCILLYSSLQYKRGVVIIPCMKLLLSGVMTLACLIDLIIKLSAQRVATSVYFVLA